MQRAIQKSILITGCSSGIGLCSAMGMKARGWRVLATARNRDDLAMLENEGLEALHLELRDPESVAACASEALERTDGRLYALFNNAAFGQPGAVEDLTVEALRDQFEVNLMSWHDLTRRTIPAMRRNGEGRIVQCSSVLGLISPPFRGAYNASKFALEALSDAMRHELTGSGIQVVLIEPGPIDTRFSAHALAALRSNVDVAASPHAEIYKQRIAQLEAGGTQRFKLGPEAVLSKLVAAVERRKPKHRYYVTFPTYMAVLGRRILPHAVSDRLIARQ